MEEMMRDVNNNFFNNHWKAFLIFIGITFFLLCMLSDANSQELPEHPQPQGGKKYLALSVAAYASTVTDIESTRHGISSCGLVETNPIVGRNPSGVKMYVVGMSMTTAYVVVGELIRRKSPNSWRWYSRMFPMIPTAIHTRATIHNYSLCGWSR
jgi:hypothetical protein